MKVIGYLVSGYPSLEGSEAGADYYVQGGCDMLEISLPLVNNREAPYLSDLMKKAIADYPDYNDHLESIRRVAKKHPGIGITILLCAVAGAAIGYEKLAAFCEEAGIWDINSPDLTDPEGIAAFRKRGIKLAGLVTYSFSPESLEQAEGTDGFIYVQAFPRDGIENAPGMDGPEDIIRGIRERGIKNPLYLGGGIRTPADAVRIKNAGGNGFFLGTSVLELYGEPEKLMSVIAEFKKAVS